MDIVLKILACTFLYGWLEYFVHRFDMHNRGSYRFKSHTIEHHGQGHMGVEQASLTQKNTSWGFIATLPITIPVALFWGWSFLLIWGLTCFWAGFAWTAVHRRIHNESGYWYAILLCPWYPLVKWNHLKHHNNPKRNYGGMFFFYTDTLALTL